MKIVKQLSKLLPPFLLFGLVFALFSPSIRYPLVDLDDFSYVTQNRIVIQGLSTENVKRAFSLSNSTATMYMPLLWISYMADVSLLGASPEHPAPFHAANVALHAANAVLLYFFLLLLSRFNGLPSTGIRNPKHATLAPFLLALLWAVHPLRVESVAWVTERKDVLSAFFGLAATLCWLVSATPSRRRHPRVFLLVAAVFFYALGLLAKPSLVPLPFAWLALDVWPLRRIPASFRNRKFLPAALRAIAEKLLFLPFALAAAWLAVAAHHAVSGPLAIPWRCRLAAVAPNFLFYVRKTLLPLRLSPLVPELWVFPLSTVFLSLAICAALAFCLWTFRRTIPSLLPGAAWILLFFLPASGLQPLPMNTVADRFFYLPAIGLSIALLGLFVPCPPNSSGRSAATSPSIAPPRRFALLGGASFFILAVLAAMTARILPHWSSSHALYSHVNRVIPNQPVAVSALAQEAIQHFGDFQTARDLLEPALAEYPGDWIIRCVYADCLLHFDSAAAAAEYLSATPAPDAIYSRASLFVLLANYHFFAGDFQSALHFARLAIPLYADDSTGRAPAVFLALGAAFESGDLPLALSFARQTRLYAGASSVSLDNLFPLAIFHWLHGYREQALPLLFRILDANPGRTELWNNVLWGLATASWSPADPSEVLARVRRMQADSPAPGHPGILDTLAAALANAGDFDAALDAIDRALAQVPDPADPFRAKLLHRRNLFAQHIPYRENAFNRIFSTAFGAPADTL